MRTLPLMSALLLSTFTCLAHAHDDDDDGGSLSPRTRSITSVGLGYTEGTRPVSSPNYTSISGRLDWRISTGFSDESVLGSHFALEGGLGIGWINESPGASRNDGDLSLMGHTALGLAGRLFHVGEARHFSLLLHAGVEADVGGALWWSNALRFAPNGGARALFRLSEKWTGDLDYTFVPDYLPGDLDGRRVNRYEHRITGTFAYGALGFGPRYMLSSERLVLSQALRSHSHTVLFQIDLRFNWLSALFGGGR